MLLSRGNNTKDKAREAGTGKHLPCHAWQHCLGGMEEEAQLQWFVPHLGWGAPLIFPAFYAVEQDA